MLATLLATSGGPAVDVAGYDSHLQAAAEIGPELQTGTLLFSNGDCLPIKVFSAGRFTHVAAVVVHEDGPWVYDSQYDFGVRKLTLEEYLLAQRADEFYVYQPRSPLTPEDAADFECYLESQLGVPYAVTHHVTGNRADGVHCSEYMTDALMAIDRIHAERPPRVSPSSLAEGISEEEVYVPAGQFELAPAEPVEPVPDTWCARMWSETRSCVARSCSQMGAWFLCQ